MRVLAAFCEGNLTGDLSDSIARHVGGCVKCEAKLASLQGKAADDLVLDVTVNVPSKSASEQPPRPVATVDFGETFDFEPTVLSERQVGELGEIDQTIDSKGSRVAISGEGSGFAELNSLLEAKRGQTAPFQAERTLAQGGMGAVLVGQDKALQRRIAIKVMKPKIAESDEHRARFLEEAQITGQLEHPNIVPIHDLGKDADGNLYFSMKLVKGQSLGQILAEMKQGASSRSLTELLNIVLKIADALAFAHSKGVVHRDLKPDNIMVGDFGEVLVMDWGLAKLLGRDVMVSKTRNASDLAVDEEAEDSIKSVRASHVSSQTVDGTIQGTPAYMPPEQALGKIDEIDQRSDVYSLGAILYEILTLERPIEGENMSQLLKNAAQGKIVPPENRTPERFIPAELSAVVMKAMRRDRNDRYPRVQDFETDIHLFLEGRAVSAKEDSLLESAIKLIRRNKAVSSAVAIAATIIMALASFSYIRISGERDRAVDSEAEAVEAQNQQWQTAMAASKQFALQTVELSSRNQLEPAQRRAKDAAIVAPEGPWQYFASGAIAMSRADISGAIAQYRLALAQRDGEQPEIRAALAEALAKDGNLNEARAVLAELDKIEDWRILLSAGRVQYEGREWDACQVTLTKAMVLMGLENDRPSASYREAKQLLDAAPAQKKCEGFHDEIRHLPFAEQKRRVLERLSEIHSEQMPPLEMSRPTDAELYFGSSGYKYEITHLYPVRGLPITELDFRSSSVWDLSPLVGMPLETAHLKECHELTDLTPLSLIPTLTELDCSETGVRDISPLSSLQLKRLRCVQDSGATSGVVDVEPLRGLPLEELDIVTSDLSPLSGMPLKHLNVRTSNLTSLEPLRGAPLESLWIDYTPISDLGPLQGMPLTYLNCANTAVTDLSALETCPIETLVLSGDRITDLSPLAKMPLKELDLTAVPLADLAALRGRSVQRLHLGKSAVTNLTPLRELPLKRLDVSMTRVHDLSPLSELALEHLNIEFSDVTDLKSIRNMPLVELHLQGCWVDDFTPLATLSHFDKQPPLAISYLRGEMGDGEFRDKMVSDGSSQGHDPDGTTRSTVIYIAMKRYSESGPAAALELMEKYAEKWGTTPLPDGDPDFVTRSLKRLREELAKQSQGVPAETSAR